MQPTSQSVTVERVCLVLGRVATPGTAIIFTTGSKNITQQIRPCHFKIM